MLSLSCNTKRPSRRDYNRQWTDASMCT